MRSLSSVILTFSVFAGLIMPSLALSQTVQTPKEAIEFGLQDGTPVKLRLSRNMSSADAKTGETVDFEVLEDIKSGDVIIIPRGAVALGTVTNAKPKGRMGKGGKLDINVDSVQAVSGEKLALRAVKENKGGSHTGAMTGAIVASSILFFPAAPFFLFMKGKDIKIPKGTEVTAYVNGDAALNRAKFVPGDSSALAAENNAAAAISDSASVALKSNPEGAEITIDGKFMGSTPSSLNLKPGDYTISITKAGYTPWQRTVTLNAKGNITLDAALEKNP